MQSQLALELLKIGAVGFSFETPLTFKSGIVSPVYVDNRQIPYHPALWKQVIRAWIELLELEHLEFEIVAGIESAGIPHSATLGYVLNKPSVFCRKQAKDHGTKKMIEGGKVEGKQVLLVEDMVTTGGSSLAGVASIREAGGKVDDCIVITSYGFAEAHDNFTQAEVRLHPLLPFADILREAVVSGFISQNQQKTVERWMADPWHWQA